MMLEEHLYELERENGELCAFGGDGWELYVPLSDVETVAAGGLDTAATDDLTAEIAPQLDLIDPQTIRAALLEDGEYSEEKLRDDAANRARLTVLACKNFCEVWGADDD